MLCVFWGMLSGLFYHDSPKDALLAVLTLESGTTNHLWFLRTFASVIFVAPLLGELRKNQSIWKYFVLLILVSTFGLSLLRRFAYLWTISTGSDFLNKVVGYVDGFRPIQRTNIIGLAYYVLGMAVSDKSSNWYKSLACCMFAPLPMTIFGYFVRSIFGASYDVTWNGYDAVGTVLLVISLYKIALCFRQELQSELVKSTVAFVGRNTMATYLLHWFARGLAKQAIALLPVKFSFIGVVAALLLIIITAGLGELIRRTPIRVLLYP